MNFIVECGLLKDMDASVNLELLGKRGKTNREKNIFGGKEYVVIAFLLIVVAGATIIVTYLSREDNNFASRGATCRPKFDYKWILYDNDTVGTVYEILLESFRDSSRKTAEKRAIVAGEGIGDLNGTYFSLS